MDDDGYVNIVGRIKDMVIRGGENVYPREIEEFLYTHPDIADVQVIGVPDERYGEELMAWVVMQPGRDAADAEAVREFCAGQARPLQGAALRARGRRLPDDGDRQGPQGRDARGGRPPAGRELTQKRCDAAQRKGPTGWCRWGPSLVQWRCVSAGVGSADLDEGDLARRRSGRRSRPSRGSSARRPDRSRPGSNS